MALPAVFREMAKLILFASVNAGTRGIDSAEGLERLVDTIRGLEALRSCVGRA